MSDELPSSWRAAIRFCPYCSGALGRADDGSPCKHCNGTGNLLGTMLLDAWQRGADHVLARVREVEAARRIAVERATTEQPSMDELLRNMGL